MLGERDFTLLWGGQTASILGDGVFTVALALEALRVSDRASTLSYVIAARVAPTVLLLLIAGAIVDRLPRRFTVLSADVVRGVAVGAIAVLVVAHSLTVTDLVVISVVVGAADAFFFPAYSAIVPEILPKTLLMEGNAFNSASQVLGQSLLGPAMGGVLIAAFGAASAFAVDAASFFVSAACVLAMRARPAPGGFGQVHARRRASPGFAGRRRSRGCGTRSSPPPSPTSRPSRPSPSSAPCSSGTSSTRVRPSTGWCSPPRGSAGRPLRSSSSGSGHPDDASA